MLEPIILDAIVPTVAGLASAYPFLGIGENRVHAWLLHVPEHRRTFITQSSAESHHDRHHGAYMGPEHYYRDVTNEHETIHFGWGKYLIPFVAGGMGLGINRLWAQLPFVDPSIGVADWAYVGGWALAGLGSYGAYESFHHMMHVIGERRYTINRQIGDRLQTDPAGEIRRDGLLRFSKPLLDDLCNEVELRVDEGSYRQFDVDLMRRLEEQMSDQPEGGYVREQSVPALLRDVTEYMIEHEHEELTKKTPAQLRKYRFSRKVQRLFRGSDTIWGRYFRRIDNNHFMHHWRFKKNLGVVYTWPDKLLGTQEDFSRERLEADRKFWLCPNSPDEEKFVDPKVRRKERHEAA